MIRLGVKLGRADYFDRLAGELRRLDFDSIENLASVVFDAFERDSMVFVCGNGGSAATASHLCQDLSKATLSTSSAIRFSQRRPRVVSLTDSVASLLAWGNDVGFETVFSEPLRNLAREGDVLIAISASGNSPNILKAVESAAEYGVVSVGVCGMDGGLLSGIADHTVHVALEDMGMVESIHSCIFHWLVDDLYSRLNRLGRYGGEDPAIAGR